MKRPTLSILPDGTEEWWLDGKLHREDGPAIINANGRQEWWLDGEQVDPVVHMVMINEKARS